MSRSWSVSTDVERTRGAGGGNAAAELPGDAAPSPGVRREWTSELPAEGPRWG